MASSTRVPATEITGVHGRLIRTISRRVLGQVPDGIGVMWHHPRVLRDSMGFGRKVGSWDRLDRGLDEAKVREVPRWRESTVFSPLERRVMEYAEAMSETPKAVTDEMSAALLEELGAPALVELTARIGTMNMTARGNVALGIRSQEFAASCGLPPLAAPSW